jgi:hypothetical protein
MAALISTVDLFCCCQASLRSYSFVNSNKVLCLRRSTESFNCLSNSLNVVVHTDSNGGARLVHSLAELFSCLCDILPDFDLISKLNHCPLYSISTPSKDKASIDCGSIDLCSGSIYFSALHPTSLS